MIVGVMFDFVNLDRGRFLLYVLIAAVVAVVGLSALRSSGGGVEAPEPSRMASRGLLPKASRSMVVDVSGAVKSPGVYRFAPGSRVIDAIKRAGGATARAFPSGLNRAALLVDGQQVVLPATLPAGSGGAISDAEPASSAVPSSPVSLGTASAVDLEQIEGIGPVTAGKIIEFRDSKGGLASVDDLDQIPGIGPATMETLRAAMQP